MLLIYTGDGKGKTSAAVGQAIRALGHGYSVVFVQFIKSNVQTGEQKILRQLLGDDFFIGGLGFCRNPEEKKKHRARAIATLEFVLTKMEKKLFMLVADEILYALQADLLTRAEIERILIKAKDNHTHLVFTGRGLPDFLLNRADLISEIKEIKHPFAQGIKAQKGIEY